ncbi:MAG: SIS domain-containing protein [Candidatus Jordarchaeaceae archaeon]
MEHYMLRETYEQPDALRRTLLEEENIEKVARILSEKEYRFYLFGCGSSHYICLCGKSALETFAEVDAYVTPSSEFYEYPPPQAKSPAVALGVSRSGETTETVRAISKANQLGALTVSITNTRESSMARNSKLAITVNAGEEKSVIMTKTFTTQVYALQLLALHYAQNRGKEVGKQLSQARKIPQLVQETLTLNEKVRELALNCEEQKFIFLGGGPSYGASLEGSLKLKETSYVHSEAYHPLEFRHGPMAVVDEKTLVICLVPERPSKEYVELIKEIKEKGAKVLAVTSGATVSANQTLTIPKVDDTLSPTIQIIPLQVFAYHYCVGRGLNPDAPRHLKKVVKI